jgi:outer membrane protein OmpA-like peptidoglycan-associated protein
MKAKQMKYFICGLLWLCSAATFAQQTNTVYFMRGIPERNVYNPAFQPEGNLYIDLPVMPNFNLNFGNNSLNFNDVIFNKNGKTMSFLDQAAIGAERNDFYNKLKNTTRINGDFALNIIGFGFRLKEKNFFTFDITQKFTGNFYLPKDLFGFALYGTEKSNTFDLSKFGMNASVYTEVGLGYSRIINDKLTLGTKLKVLFGQANIHSKLDNFDLTANYEEWTIKGNGTLNSSIPFTNIKPKSNGAPDFDNSEFFENIKAGDLTSGLFSNLGFGIDLGATYQVLPNLQLSAALTDLGFITWKKNLNNWDVNNNYSFKGVEYDVNNEDITIGDLFSDQLDSLGNSFKFSNSNKSYTTYLSARLNVGAEHSILNDKIGFGLLSSTLFVDKNAFSDLTASVNFRPVKWFNPSISYSLLDGQWSSLGIGAQLKLGIFNMYLAVDQIPVGSKTYSKQYIPTHLKSTNVQMGMVWVFNGPKDDDKDGVKNKKDRCPNTPLGVLVDAFGCPLDADGDGVPDYLDMCPNTPEGVQVDASGCPLDSDGDGVPDYLDQCPNTPEGIAVDVNGCPLDSDGDGVLDYLDKCPNTPAGVQVDENGCPLDGDGDGVPDYLDKCPNTPEGIQVDENGCPLDTDGDGIPDYLDACPAVAGTVDNKGCPEVKEEVRQIFRQALTGIQFETGKAVIKTTSHPILNKIVMVMDENPAYFLLISGHTDNVGKPESNQILSEKRAAAVKEYLINHGIAESRLTSLGFGDTQPVDTNKTAAGRTKNRRVDFEVKFETIEYKTVK